MKTGLKFYFRSIQLCFFFVWIFQCKCQSTMNSLGVDQLSSDSLNASKPVSLNYTTQSTTLAIPLDTKPTLPVTESTTVKNSTPTTSNSALPPGTNSTPILPTSTSSAVPSSTPILPTSTSSAVPSTTQILPNSTLPKVQSSTPILPTSTSSAVPSCTTESSKKSDGCEQTSIFCGWFILFVVFAIVCICGLACVVYFLYLKRLEIKSKECGCQIEQIDPSKNQPRGILLHDMRILDPATRKISFKGESENSSGYTDSEIATWDIYKYLELLKTKNQPLYEELVPTAQPSEP